MKRLFSFQKLARITGNCIKFSKERIKAYVAIECLKQKIIANSPQVVDANDGTRHTRKRGLRTLHKMLSLSTLKKTLTRTLSLRTLKGTLLLSTLKRTLSLGTLKRTLSMSTLRRALSLTEDPKKIQSNIDTTMQAIVEAIQVVWFGESLVFEFTALKETHKFLFSRRQIFSWKV